MADWFDATLYPDEEPPEHIESLADQVDFLCRLCAAWDFGILPKPETIAEIRREHWRTAVEACNLLTSPAYHLLREWHGLEPRPYLGQQLSYIRDDPWLSYV
ncbi:MAG: hypothetical protein HND44_06705 [Chloroflexi bacterium]|nr:hypothetical protein [Ardenticatenaceae bacterium]MBL1128180.1 hypothetical protein [Chloroflexota bacterium]NOG34253.1 hypothetical protein [Chloroflexota bacterium]GIK56367.1 MAG: hypothetical protein BroJett015_20300 [Chloroflexota bacterium]